MSSVKQADGQHQQNLTIENHLESDPAQQFRLSYYEWILECMSQLQLQLKSDKRED